MSPLFFFLQGLLVNCNSIEQDWVSKVMREHFELEVSHLTATRMAEVGKQIEAVVCSICPFLEA